MLLPGATLWVAAVIGTAASPTDAALGAAVLADPAVPARIRRILTVESGLNDGIATPFVSMFIALAATVESQVGLGPPTPCSSWSSGWSSGWGRGGRRRSRLRWCRRAGWSADDFVPIAAAALALVAYSAAVIADGNGFIAAFVGGMAFGTTAFAGRSARARSLEADPGVLRPRIAEHTLSFANGGGEVLAGIVWFLFGAAFRDTVPLIGWRQAAFAVVALTVVRMVPVALALIGAGVTGRTVAFVGWAGPRGLATVVFGLLAVADLPDPDASLVTGALGATVLLSVVAHGLSAGPLARRYGEAERRNDGAHDQLPPGVAAVPPRGRLLAPG